LALAIGLDADVEIVPVEEAFDTESPEYNYKKALEIALEAHLNILANKYGMMASREDYQATKRRLFHPTIRLSGGGFGWSISDKEEFDGLEDLILKNYSYGVGLSVNMPIFNMNTTNGLKRQKLTYLRRQSEKISDWIETMKKASNSLAAK
jgi:outer membrane protein TolC